MNPRDNKRTKRSLREAKLRYTQACIEGIEYPVKRELDKAVIRQLATCRWIQEHQAVLITGATGTGKSWWVACALAHQACRKGFRAIYRRAHRFFDEMRLARADGSYPRMLARLARIDVLVLDDFAIAPVSDQDVTFWRVSKIDRRAAPRSSPASSTRSIGTTTSAIPPLPTPSATASSAAPIGSC